MSAPVKHIKLTEAEAKALKRMLVAGTTEQRIFAELATMPRHSGAKSSTYAGIQLRSERPGPRRGLTTCAGVTGEAAASTTDQRKSVKPASKVAYFRAESLVAKGRPVFWAKLR